VVKCGECDSLNGIPGIHSVANDEDKVMIFLRNLKLKSILGSLSEMQRV